METATLAIAVDTDDERLRSLAVWLRDDDISVSFAGAPIRPGQMGGLLESVTVVLTAPTAAAVVASICGWLNHKRDARKVSLKLKSPAGKELDLTCGSADDAKQVTESVRLFLEDDA